MQHSNNIKAKTDKYRFAFEGQKAKALMENTQKILENTNFPDHDLKLSIAWQHRNREVAKTKRYANPEVNTTFHQIYLVSFHLRFSWTQHISVIFTAKCFNTPCLFQTAHTCDYSRTCMQLVYVPAIDQSSLDVQYSKALHLVSERNKQRARPVIQTARISPWLHQNLDRHSWSFTTLFNTESQATSVSYVTTNNSEPL